MSIVFSHPTGNANVRAAVLGLNQAGLLSEFRTSIASFPGSLVDMLGAIGPLSEIRRRRFDASLKYITQQYPWIEIGRMLSQKAGINRLTRHEVGYFCIDKVYQSIDRDVTTNLKYAKKHGVSTIYAYEDGAQLSFKEAKKLGLTCIYDLPIGYWRTARRLMENERLRYPEWASTLTGFQDSDAKLARKDEELHLADHIFVASKFTASTLKEFPGKLPAVEVIPYGFPPVVQKRNFGSILGFRPLKLLFVGGLSQRKGIANLFAAVEAFGHHVALTVVGRKASNDCPVLDAALAKHQWIPSLPHEEVLKLMHAHDVLVFPSLFEGFGLVITEAMSQGTPVITTERTAGPDLIAHDQNGWLVEAGSTEAIQLAIEKLINHPEKIKEAGKAAMETARLRTWEVYGQELAKAIKKIQFQ
ncbi:glycosyltransferase family 4 protein [Catalinimonas niigatensis]|uniref:glycosyltransferase family 4 protein n=1 Tax=Catalinimonas niigatensis TaxID=1397264 RepID=UPI002664FF12|nr:glycosyltransferase family 4 protein [Catalinimonas niigatensis]WPP52900.1 glycosyltransferase family 4 protein [Catalinimonas niigatensis]